MSLRCICRNSIVVLLVLATLPLAAQTTDTGQSSNYFNYVQPSAASSAPPAQGYDEYKPATWEVFTGYSWMTLNQTVVGVKEGFPATFRLKDARGGFVIDVSYFFNKWFGLTVDTGAHFGEFYDADEAFVGPVLRFPGEHIQIFVHGLAGWSRLSPGNADQQDGPGFAVGGGIDLRVAKHLSIRLGEADYIWSNHDFGPKNDNVYDGARLSAGLVFLGGVGEELPKSASCSVDHSEIWPGEPVKATATPSGFDPKHTLNYDWTTNGGKVEGSGGTVTINTTGIAEGQTYNVSAHVSDPHNKKALASCQTSFSTRKRLPPTISCSASPDTITQGDSTTINSQASSPQGDQVKVTITSTCAGGGEGTAVTLNTSMDTSVGTCNVTCNVADEHGLTGSSSTSFKVNKKIVEKPRIPKNIVLRSVYFATAIPTTARPNAGLIASQQETLRDIATAFKNYQAQVPGAKLNLQGFADIRGGDEYNKKLSERRVNITQKFLESQGISADSFQTEAYGKDRQLSAAEVKGELDKNQELNQLTPGERTRILKNIRVIELASNRRVDVSLITPDQDTTQTTVREYPFRASDWLTLIGGREKKKAPPKTPAPKKKTTKGGTKKKK